MHRYSMTQMKKTVLLGAACAVLVAAMITGIVFAALLKPEIYDKLAQDGAPQDLLYSVKVVQTSNGKDDFAPDKKMGETGFIRPGTFVESVKLNGLTAGAENPVLVKIATMNEADRTSNGFFYIRTTIS